MLQILRKAIKRMVHRQMIVNKSNKDAKRMNRRFTISHAFALTQKRRTSRQNSKEGDKFQLKPKERFKKIVEDKIIFKRIRSKEVQQLNLLDYLVLFRMQNAFADVFDELACPDLLRKYSQLGINQFKNDYLRDLVQEQPQYAEEFMVFADDIEFRDKLIIPDEALRKLR